MSPETLSVMFATLLILISAPFLSISIAVNSSTNGKLPPGRLSALILLSRRSSCRCPTDT
jgi:hypothetical protein